MIDRLIQVGRAYWDDLEGYVTAHGGSALRDLPLDRFCGLVWWWITRNAETEQDVERVREQVWLPPKGEEPTGVWAADAETEALHGLMEDLGIE